MLIGNKMSGIAVMNEITDRSSCANCGNLGEVGKEMAVCGRCKNATYCSRDCQLAHWKIHKPRCATLKEVKKAAYEGGQKQVFRFMQNWKDQIKNGVLGYLTLSTFGYDTLQSLRTNEQFIYLNVKFDYNKRTFLPTQEPKIMDISDIEAVNASHAQAMRQTYQDLAASKTNINIQKGNVAIVLVFLTCKGMNALSSILPISVEEQPLTKASWKDLMKLLEHVKVTSSKFEMWNNLLRDNIKLQIQTTIKSHASYQPFLVNALRIESKPSTQRHKTHVIVIPLIMGYGLGEIQSLGEYQVKPVGQVIADMEAGFKDTVSPEQFQYYKSLLDLENCPVLLQSRQTRPFNVLVPIVFFAEACAFSIEPNLMEVIPGHDRSTTAKCDKKARQLYATLCQAKFPSVESPSLS